MPLFAGFLIEPLRKLMVGFVGMTRMMSQSIRALRSQSASMAMSARRCPADRPLISVSVSRRLWTCPGISQKSTRFQTASVRASIFVVMPPA